MFSWPIDRYRGTHCTASALAWLQFSGFLPVGTCKNPCVCSSCWQRRETSPSHSGCLSDYLQLPWASLNGCGGPWRDVSRRELNLVENILGIYYKCTLLAVTPKLKIFRTNVLLDIFSFIATWNSFPKFLRILQLHFVYLQQNINRTHTYAYIDINTFRHFQNDEFPLSD
jgi:hypothetical protein